ncbi:radical SAM additional 4Fe4S-binding SPASM domain-containing protein [Clostridium cavendishii DSM 21758]|uniref:Radical SAM additional 4Fe4S-binding SPASM domain-containing protein n=1 Tax=Clostridium cavendishii DSM 21758 TaxID=1121302 RepID=A0A1M6EYT3_9CLOT|nr:radical SAM protein [Clostridium cavendishii]SHI90617.1 radical SAM additional 4Fe4S-binding SPASM domain-containing protein [Clostridium cavendishii DSM 21758]
MECKEFNRLILQWHITNRCNQRCKHCYQESYSNKELDFEEILYIIEEYKKLLIEYSNLKGSSFIRGHINITGGEPFVRTDFISILEEFYKNREYFSYGILTNGSFITPDIAKKLRKLSVSHVQVSIDGNQKEHDYLRGSGNFNQTFKAIRMLNKENIRTMVSFTAHKNNYRQFKSVAKVSRKNKVSKLWTDRLIPIGNGMSMVEDVLNPIEALEYFGVLKSEEDKSFLNKISGLEVYTERGLQFLKSGKNPYACSAGDSLITILENGDVMPCRRLPIICGNVLKESLKSIYINNNIFKELKTKAIPKECAECVYAKRCKGGLKCLAYSIYKDYNRADPACPILYKLNSLKNKNSVI